MIGDTWLKESRGKWHLFWSENGYIVRSVYAGKNQAAAEKFKENFERVQTTRPYRFKRRQRYRSYSPPFYGNKRQVHLQTRKHAVEEYKKNLSLIVARADVIIHLLAKLAERETV